MQRDDDHAWGAGGERRALLDAVGGISLILDPDLRIVDASQRARDILGGVMGSACFEALRGRDEICPGCPALQSLRDSSRAIGREVIRTGTGGWIEMPVVANPIPGSDGSTAGVVLTEHRSTTRQVRADLTERGEVCHTLFEEVPCYVSVQDRDFRVVHANRLVREDFGPLDSVPDGYCYELYKHRTEPCLHCPVAETFDDGESHSSEEMVVTRSGEPAHVLVVTAPLRDSTGEVAQVIEMSTNITEIRSMRSQLESIGMLVGQISHAIKGVLNGLDGGIYLVSTAMERDDPDRLRQGWEMVRRNVDRVRTLVLDILYYAKDREPQYRLASPTRVAEEVVARFESKVKEHGIDLTTSFDPAAVRFEVDVRGIEALLTNLIENAVDACRADPDASGHTVEVSVLHEGENVCFKVSDDGVGMDREGQEKAFTLFFSSKGSGGTGLGLYIAHRIATKHEGTLSLESALGRGTTFTLRLPVRRPKRARPSPAVAPDAPADGG